MWDRARNPFPQPAGLTKGKVPGRITLKYSIPNSLHTIKCASWNLNSKPTSLSQLLWKRLPSVYFRSRLRLGLLCIFDYNNMLPLLPENISED